jgi:hypothetical protein
LKSIGVFLVFGSVMAALAGVTLVWPGTALDSMWRLNPRAYAQLAPLGRAAGIPFLLLGFGLAIASVGWFKLRIWGWRIAVAVIAIQVLGDGVNVFLKHFVGGAVGVAIAGALLFYLLRPEVKDSFTVSGSDQQRSI